ncbi:hypothetical protein ACWGDS_25275 [Streptomyces sp. NPDC055059]|uniref:hypothetical protein n=1 Tax=Streptomyces sp. NPDC127172 TaxID=3345382 RepID=UPI003624DBE9
MTVVCGERRLPGVRREEVPQLAPVYYTGMKRVKLRGASTSVLRSLTRILRMDETETQHRSTR